MPSTVADTLPPDVASTVITRMSDVYFVSRVILKAMM